MNQHTFKDLGKETNKSQSFNKPTMLLRENMKLHKEQQPLLNLLNESVS